MTNDPGDDTNGRESDLVAAGDDELLHAAERGERGERGASGPVRGHHTLAAIGGVVAAAAALATGEVVGELVDSAPSPVIAVADVIVAETPGGVVEWSIETIGSAQQTLLTWGVVLASLAVGAVLGLVALHRTDVAVAGFVAFGIVGGWAGARSPARDWFPAWATAIVAAAVGIAVLLGTSSLLATGRTPAPTDEERPRVVADHRRTFLKIAGGATAWAIVGPVIGRTIAPDGAGDAARQDVAGRLGLGDGPATSVARGGTLDTVDGISQYLTPNPDFYLIDTALRSPQVDPDSWELRIHGMVDEETTFSFADLLEMERIERVVTLACVSNEVGGDLVGNARWTGVPLADVLARAGVQEGATQIVGRSADGFTAGFPTAVGLDGRPSMVAVAMNGEPLPVDHGFPARLIVPGLYGYVSATKWLTEIELTTLEAFDAYWIRRGWAKEGPIETQSRIDVPGGGSTVGGAPTVLAGVAWAPTRGISAVEVRIDDGEWVQARLNDQVTDLSWRQWVLEQELTAGAHTATVRATDGTGTVQTSERSSPHPAGATGWHSIDFTVA